MSENVYQTPDADLVTGTEADAQKFYVVSRLKLSLLFLSTFSAYSVYWFYVNWKNYKVKTGDDVSPALRAIFYIFFTHALFDRVQDELDSKGLSFTWAKGMLATIFVILSLLSSVVDRLVTDLVEQPILQLASFGFLPFMLFIMLKAQDAINLSQDDPEASTNRQFTLANYAWMIFGILLWTLILIGVFAQ